MQIKIELSDKLHEQYKEQLRSKKKVFLKNGNVDVVCKGETFKVRVVLERCYDERNFDLNNQDVSESEKTTRVYHKFATNYILKIKHKQ